MGMAERTSACQREAIANRISLAVIALSVLLALSLAVGCAAEEPLVSLPTESAEQGQIPQAIQITVDSYASDVFQAAGHEITLGGVRFPMPTTLNELGPDWHFDEDKRWYAESTSYYEGTDIPCVITTTRLYFQNYLIAPVFVKDKKSEINRDTLIVNIGYSTKYYESNSVDLACDGFMLGASMDSIILGYGNKGVDVSDGNSRIVSVVVGDYHAVFIAMKNEKEDDMLSEGINKCSMLDIGINISTRPNNERKDSFR
jgi:hypothetical protein